jgi:hypothetical protein
MFFNENQVRYLTSQFMPRLKEDPVKAMIDVACHGHSILGSAQKYGITHQSLSKNLINLKGLQDKIFTARGLFPSGYLLGENAHALLIAEVSFSESVKILQDMCHSLGGKVEYNEQTDEVKFYLEKILTILYLNPNKTYEYDWTYVQCELD